VAFFISMIFKESLLFSSGTINFEKNFKRDELYSF